MFALRRWEAHSPNEGIHIFLLQAPNSGGGLGLRLYYALLYILCVCSLVPSLHSPAFLHTGKSLWGVETENGLRTVCVLKVHPTMKQSKTSVMLQCYHVMTG